ncbi:protein kinase [Streptomyces sp. NPDC001941]|uniref:serine/threonine-protein kinase n=1 Tax=Streptomyces sp. NPDC001941 TaxID=3154659 RepID=UPI00331C3BD7
MEQSSTPQGAGHGLVLAGRYRLSESIGSGGMGKVWRAHDEVLHRIVAVKELTAGRYASEADRVVLVERTRKEARAAARITHPSVVTVHDVLEHDDRPWIVMQYVDGPSLAEAAKERGSLDPREAARVGLHVLGALRAAHGAGVLHRDVKPANVLLARDGRVLITDFGIAAIEGDSTITRTGEIVGSIDYLAPERVRGGAPGPASDLWSLGATLYAAVQGESPFRRTSPIETMQAVVTEEPPVAPRAGALGPVISALLRKEPDERPGAAEVERMLLDAMEGRAPAAAQAYVPTQRLSDLDARAALPTGRLPGPPTTSAPAPAAGRPGRRWRTAVLVVLLAAVVGTGAGLAGMYYADRDRERGSASSGGATTGGGETSPAPRKSSGNTADTAGGDEVPAGWHRVRDPEGFSLLVPKGWKRQLDGNQIDYTPDNGRHRIRISVDGSPDFENPYVHMLDVEKSLRKRLPQYQRMTLHSNTFRDQVKSCLWEFTWSEEKDHPGPRRAIDQVYYADDGTEYALYMSGPQEDWDTTRQQFDVMLRSWRPKGA